MGDSETVVYLRRDGKLVIWNEDYADGWIVLDPDVIVQDDDALTGHTTLDDWK